MTTQPATIIPALAYQRSTANTRFSPIEQNVYPVNMRVVGGKTDECVSSPSIISRVEILDVAHYLTSGMTSFGRGLNDAPKIIPFVMIASQPDFGLPAGQAGLAGLFHLTPFQGYLFIAMAMGLGGLISGRRVVQTLSERITSLSRVDGFLANTVTAGLVLGGAWFGWPMSTTHVSTSAIAGAGVNEGRPISWKVIREIVMAWIVTVPLSAAIAIVAALVVQRMVF